MSLVIDTLRTSPVTEELNEAEIGILAELFEVQEYKAGDVIVQPGDVQNDNLYILAYGDIEVKIEAGGGEESTVHVLKPGDLAGMITFAGGAATQISATLYAVGATKVLSMQRSRFETLINSHPRLLYRVMRGIIRNMHGIVRRVNSESAELSNYINKIGGRY
ncbi:MAG: cyclic nucleotide-binding domain-containing protein [Gallionella sp.]|nr:cyclic nucleotide-binding domain-containing protein [Gallionella sp.]MDD4946319.1 cyclic nucleotide-binding domain-containing protein [Gallionella sp.]MDD5613388.1 cyclic nucleotide-binding domain-containing protein [Gallionella sp.]